MTNGHIIYTCPPPGNLIPARLIRRANDGKRVVYVVTTDEKSVTFIDAKLWAPGG